MPLTYRILDANTNRAAEGLRVVEDYLRFVRQDQQLCRVCKQLRHDLTEALRDLPSAELRASRATLSDVGTQVSTGQEYQREDIEQIADANLSRVAQALRSLEEYSKLLCRPLARRLESLRYRLYVLEQAVSIGRASESQLAATLLYVLVDGAASLEEFAQRCQLLIDCGVHALQLRDKRLGDRALAERARCLRGLTRGTDILCIINDRPDIAALAGADGVHVGQEELQPSDVRTVVGENLLVGVSTHSLTQAREAVLNGASYLGVGPVFDSRTKHFEEFPGLDLIEAVTDEIKLPAFAIGGIAASNIDRVISAGASRVAVGAAVWSAPDPRQEIIALLEHLNQRRHRAPRDVPRE
jgi:thiamine-phosphate pyrophosphorylase